MTKKKLFACIISTVLILTLVSSDFTSFAALFTFETQYNSYTSADIAWLTDLSVKEDMTTAAGMAQSTVPVPKPDYPFTETPASFKKDVGYFCSLYLLQEGAQRAAYIYMFDLLGQNSELISTGVSDSDIRTYLENAGIKYPANVGSDELILARALYSAMASGAFDNTSFDTDATLEETLMSYISSVGGIDTAALKQWMPGGSVLSLDEYILAASKLALYSNGYDVSVNSSSDEVFRKMAVMTIEAQGISADSNLTFDQLKVKYMAAMLGAQYEVTVDSAKLSSALADDTVPFYILQLIGQKSNLSIRQDNASYEDAFYLVAQNTHFFDVQDDEFYADIMEYDVFLNYKRSSIWIYPTAYATGDSSCTLSVAINGKTVRNNYYNEITLDTSLSVQTVKIVVNCTKGSNSSICTYYINVHQGDKVYKPASSETTSAGAEESFESSDSIVSKIMSTLGINSSVTTVVDKLYTSLPASVKNVISVISPTFDTSASPSGNDTQNGGTKQSDSYFITLLDKIGSVVNSLIGGIDGVNLSGKYGAAAKDTSYITFE